MRSLWRTPELEHLLLALLCQLLSTLLLHFDLLLLGARNGQRGLSLCARLGYKLSSAVGFWQGMDENSTRLGQQITQIKGQNRLKPATEVLPRPLLPQILLEHLLTTLRTHTAAPVAFCNVVKQSQRQTTAPCQLRDTHVVEFILLFLDSHQTG